MITKRVGEDCMLQECGGRKSSGKNLALLDAEEARTKQKWIQKSFPNVYEKVRNANGSYDV